MSNTGDEDKLGRRLRAVVLTALLTGALFPSVGGVPIHAAAMGLAVPLIMYELLRPGRSPALALVALLFGPLLIAEWLLLPDVVTTYGQEKVRALFTSTLLSALGVALLRDRRSVLTFAKVWVLVTVILAVVTIVSGGGAGRATTFDSNPIWLARAMGSGAVAIVWLGWHGYVRRLLWVPTVGGLVGAVVLTGSRGPAAGMIAGLAVIAGLAASGRSRRLITLGGAIGIALFVASYVPSVRSSRLFSFMGQTRSTEDTDVSLRSEMWSRSWDLIWREPGGVGFGNWAQLAPSPSQHEYPHSLYLEVFAEVGWAPGALFLGTVLLVFVRLVRRAQYDATVSLALGMLTAEALSVAVSGDLNARSFFAMLTLGWVVTAWPLRATCDPDDRASPNDSSTAPRAKPA